MVAGNVNVRTSRTCDRKNLKRLVLACAGKPVNLLGIVTERKIKALVVFSHGSW